MDTRFFVHNSHLDNPRRFSELDPQLRRLKKSPYINIPALLSVLPSIIPGIYTITGSRQIGKTTLLKQWIQKLLNENVNPEAIVFFSGELIENSHSLLNLLQSQLELMNKNKLNFIIIDEITYIKDWDKAIKYAADSGWLDDTILMLTGSDSSLIQEARVRFPGRRGKADIVNFHMYPLSFRELVDLKHPSLKSPSIELLFKEWDQYLLHGGYITAINDMAEYGYITNSTLSTYSDWIRGDMLKRGKQEHYLKEILIAIIKRYTSQVTWNALSKELSIDHHKTVSDYVILLEEMDAVFIQSALLEDKLCAAPKKARKIVFGDPFIFHAIHAWLEPDKQYFQNQMVSLLADSDWKAKLTEATAITLYRRYYSTFYIKSEGEVDIAYIYKGHFFPIEIKWTNQLRTTDLKQILKYKNGKILTKRLIADKFNHLETEPLPLALWELKGENNKISQ